MVRTGAQGTVQWRTYLSGERSMINQAETHVLMNEGAWQKLWSRVTGRDPSGAPRDIDWNKDVMVLICLGQRPTGGYSVQIESIRWKDAGTITVRFSERQPAPGALTTEALTAPFVIAKVQRPVGNFTFEKVPGTTVGTWPRVDPPNWGGNDVQIIPIEWEHLASGTLRIAPARQTAVLDDADELDRYVKGILGLTSSRFRVNFSRDVVVALHGEASRTTPLEVEVSRVMLRRDGMVAIYWGVSADDAPDGLPGSPYTLITVPRYTTEPVFFRQR